MQEIKFSVLIPVYNVEKFLTECIESVLKQTYQNFEVILIDDGSTDSSGILCDEYVKKDNRIKAYHQANQGLIMARRNAIPRANGGFCLFLDSDDYWEYDLLETIHTIIDEYYCDLIIFNYKKVSEIGTFISKSKSVFQDKTTFNQTNKEQLFKEIISSYHLNNLCLKVVKRTLLEKDHTDYSEYKKIKYSEDLLQSLPLVYSAEKIIYIDKSMYNYRMVSTSIINTFNIDLIRDITTVADIVLEYMRKLEIDSADNLKAFYTYYISCTLTYILNLIGSNNSKKEKIEILNRIKNVPLYAAALNYIVASNFTLKDKILFCLFSKKNYQLLFLLERVIFFLRKIKANHS